MHIKELIQIEHDSKQVSQIHQNDEECPTWKPTTLRGETDVFTNSCNTL